MYWARAVNQLECRTSLQAAFDADRAPLPEETGGSCAWVQPQDSCGAAGHGVGLAVVGEVSCISGKKKQNAVKSMVFTESCSAVQPSR